MVSINSVNLSKGLNLQACIKTSSVNVSQNCTTRVSKFTAPAKILLKIEISGELWNTPVIGWELHCMTKFSRGQSEAISNLVFAFEYL